jgi:inhibitor of cysteine peptidase
MRFLVSVCLVACSLATARAGESKPVPATVGQEFKIILPSNPTTGYQWVLVKPPDGKLAKLLRSDYLRPDSKLMGAGGHMMWTFKALGEGTTEMKLNYLRPWEKGQKPVQTTNFVVIVKAGTLDGTKPPAKPGN